LSEEHKRKIGEVSLGRKHSEETKRKISEGNLGKNLGRKHSEETKRKIGEASLDRKHSEETKRKISKGNLGKKISEYQKLQISKVHSGKKISEYQKLQISKANLGKKVSQESREKMRVSVIKYIERTRLGGKPMIPRIGQHETQILNKIEIIYNTIIIRQFKVAGYFVDGYDKENNIVYEIDEKNHFGIDEELNDRDKNRQKIITERLGCKFIRIKDLKNQKFSEILV